MIDVSPLSVSQLFPYFALILLFCIGKNSWITQRQCAENWFFSICWLNWKTFNNFLEGLDHALLHFGRVTVIFLFCSLKQQNTSHLYRKAVLRTKNSTKILDELLYLHPFWVQMVYLISETPWLFCPTWTSISCWFFFFFLSEVAPRRDAGAEGQ